MRQDAARVPARRVPAHLFTRAYPTPSGSGFDFRATRGGISSYVMEPLAGRDLESMIRELGPLSADLAMFLLRQVCHSLAVHARRLPA
jgi:serine/threonine protein kinase